MKVIIIIILSCSVIWQVYLLYFLSEMNDVIEAFGAEPGNMLMFLSLTQPIVLILVMATIVAIYDIYKRKELLVLNGAVIVFLVFVSTAASHLLSMLSGYGPIFEMGNS